MTELEGCAPNWQMAYLGPKDGYFGHNFEDIDFKFVLL